MRNIFISKYRPNTLDDVIGQERIVENLKRFVENRSTPHMLFEGKPGIGKTTCANAFMRDLFGENWKTNTLRVNASDDSGVENVRTTVKTFCRTAPIETDFKIVFLDEFDYISDQSQAVLRRVMEDFSKRTRFILSCNYSYKVIDPIKDRCAIFRFQPLSQEEIYEMLSKVREIEIEDGAKYSIASASCGSMRKALNILETMAIGRDKITCEMAQEGIDRYLANEDVEMVLDMIAEKNVKGLHEKTYEITRYKGISPWEFIHAVLVAVEEGTYTPEQKMAMAMICGEVDWRVSQGANPEVQLSCGFREMMKVL